MELIDLSRELFHRTQTHPSIRQSSSRCGAITREKKYAGNTVFTSKALSIALSDHAGTHVDAPVHFDPRPGASSIDEVPLENFYTVGDLPRPVACAAEARNHRAEMEAALDKSGQQIRPRDTVLLYMATNDRLLGKPGYLHDFPGLALESVHWLADNGIVMFGVEAISPAPEGEPNYLAHMACAERGITHMECLANLDKLVGRGRFRFIGFPLKIRGGTASPIRAVAVFE